PRAAALGASASANGEGPVVFSMADDDDGVSFEEQQSPGRQSGSPSHRGMDLLESPAKASVGGASDDLHEYEKIEAQFERFRARQAEVERNVAALLQRLNTQVRVPSSVASSECGDLTSLASSEWDAESLGPTEDGLSFLGSRAGSPPRSPLMSPRGESGEASSSGAGRRPAQADGRAGAGPADVELPARPARHSTGTVRGGGERGDLLKLTPRKGTDSQGADGAVAAAAAAGTRAPAGGGSLAAAVPAPPPGAAAEAAGEGAGSAEAAGSARLGAEGAEPVPAVPEPAPAVQATAPRLTEQLLAESEAVAQRPSGTPPPAGRPEAEVRRDLLPRFGAASADPSCHAALVPRGGDEAGDEDWRWQGWTMFPTQDGRLFFHHEAQQKSQWYQPDELSGVLGEWKEVVDESQPSRPMFWRNELLRLSLWKDPRNTPSIFQAALDGNLFFMQLYAEVEGQLDVVDPAGLSALHYACAGGSMQSTIFLLQRQAELDKPDKTGATPLIFACRYGYAEVVKVLLDAGASLQAACQGGNTALHEAAAMGQLDCCHLLLLCGADASLPNDSAQTPLDLAASNGNHKCHMLLRHHQQNIPRPDAPWAQRAGPEAAARAPAPPPPPGPAPAQAARSPPPAGWKAALAPAAPPRPASAGGPPAAAAAASPPRPAQAARERRPSAGAAASRSPSARRSQPAAAAGGGPEGEEVQRGGSPPGAAVSRSPSARRSRPAATRDGLEGEEVQRGGSPRSSGTPTKAAGGPEQIQLRGSPRSSGTPTRAASPIPPPVEEQRRGVLGFVRGLWRRPIRADLGVPNQYRYNPDTMRWELPPTAQR
ncbi:unnamed protein product, partial [Prorocentrum cordatum]